MFVTDFLCDMFLSSSQLLMRPAWCTEYTMAEAISIRK
jgi:hypothetical protein